MEVRTRSVKGRRFWRASGGHLAIITFALQLPFFLNVNGARGCSRLCKKIFQLDLTIPHYSDLYSRENNVSHSALDAVEYLPTMEELDTDATVEEPSKAIDSLTSGKAHGSDGIPQR